MKKNGTEGRRVLMISTDRNLLDPKSAVARRHTEYGSLAEEIHIILFSHKSKHLAETVSLASNVIVYPTASSSHWFYIFDAYKIGLLLLRKQRISLISAQNPFETGLVAWRLSQRSGVPFDVQLHTDPFTPYFVLGHSFMNRLRVWLARQLLPRARSVRVVSERIRRHIVSLFPSIRVSVLPIFVDVKKIASAMPTHDLHKEYPQFKTIILALSRLEPEKNIDLGIGAFSNLKDKHPGLGLVVIGKGSERPRLEKLAADLGVSSRVVFRGWADDPVSAFKTTDIFLLMSDFEGFALTLVEAAAAKRAIVTTDVGLVGDILKDEESALACKPRDLSAMTEKLDRLASDATLRTRLGESAFKAVTTKLMSSNDEYLRAYGALWND